MRKYVGSGQLYSDWGSHWKAQEKFAPEKFHYSKTIPLFGKLLVIFKSTLKGN